MLSFISGLKCTCFFSGISLRWHVLGLLVHYLHIFRRKDIQERLAYDHTVSKQREQKDDLSRHLFKLIGANEFLSQ